MWLSTVGFALSGYQLATASMLAFDTSEGTMPSKSQGYFLAGMAAISGFILFAISRGLETKEYSAEEANTESWEENGLITNSFPPLYKVKFGSDKIQEWAVWTEYDEATDTSTVMTEHGTAGGTITPSAGEIITEGKGKRTVREQADGVALSKWRVKRRKGYVEDLDITPDSVFIAPMTALNFHEHGHKIDFPAIAQRKYDGVRCIADTQLDGTVNLITRRGKHFYDLDHIRDEIGAMGLPPTIRLDGEMYADPSIMSFEESCGLVKRKTWSDADLERVKNIGYHLYDMIDLENLNMPYMERYAFLKALVEKYKPTNIDVVDNYEVNSEEEARILHDQFVEEGYEGLMFRNKDSPYAIDRQSKDLQKYKDFQDAEFEVVGFTEGKGRNKGTVIWKCQMPDNGRTFNVQPKGTAAQRREWFEHGDEYIGKMLTVKFFRLTEKGVPFHGTGIVFRDYEAETIIPKKGTVQTMSGKPHIPRKLVKDKDISPEEAGKRQSFAAHRTLDAEAYKMRWKTPSCVYSSDETVEYQYLIEPFGDIYDDRGSGSACSETRIGGMILCQTKEGLRIMDNSTRIEQKNGYKMLRRSGNLIGDPDNLLWTDLTAEQKVVVMKLLPTLGQKVAEKVYEVDDEDYWDMVDSLGWESGGFSSKNSDAVQERFYRHHTPSQVEGFSKITDKKKSLILENIVDRENVGSSEEHGSHTGSDDSTADFIYHLIGLGAKHFKEVVENAPNLSNEELSKKIGALPGVTNWSEWGDTFDVPESFSYLMPDYPNECAKIKLSTDLKSITPRPETIKELREGLEAIYQHDPYSQRLLKLRFNDWLKALMPLVSENAYQIMKDESMYVADIGRIDEFAKGWNRAKWQKLAKRYGGEKLAVDIMLAMDNDYESMRDWFFDANNDYKKRNYNQMIAYLKERGLDLTTTTLK